MAKRLAKRDRFRSDPGTFAQATRTTRRTSAAYRRTGGVRTSSPGPRTGRSSRSSDRRIRAVVLVGFSRRSAPGRLRSLTPSSQRVGYINPSGRRGQGVSALATVESARRIQAEGGRCLVVSLLYLLFPRGLLRSGGASARVARNDRGRSLCSLGHSGGRGCPRVSHTSEPCCRAARGRLTIHTPRARHQLLHHPSQCPVGDRLGAADTRPGSGRTAVAHPAGNVADRHHHHRHRLLDGVGPRARAKGLGTGEHKRRLPLHSFRS